MPLLLLADQFKVTGIVLFWIGEATVSFDGVAMLWTGAPGAAGTVAGGAVGVTLLEGAEAGPGATAVLARAVAVEAGPVVRTGAGRGGRGTATPGGAVEGGRAAGWAGVHGVAGVGAAAGAGGWGPGEASRGVTRRGRHAGWRHGRRGQRCRRGGWGY